MAKKYPDTYSVLNKHLEACSLCQKEVERINENEISWFQVIPCPAPTEKIKSAAYQEIRELSHSLIKYKAPKKTSLKMRLKNLLKKS